MILVGGAISESEKRIIDVLEDAGPQGVVQGELPRILGLSKSWVSEILSSLERRGIVVRMRGPGKTLIVKLSKYADPYHGKTISVGLVPSIEYLPLSLMMKKLKDRGFMVEISLKRSVVDVATSFMRGELHIAYLPIYTLAVMSQLGARFRVLGAAALGGASIVGHRVSDPGITRIFTSALSTMEVLTMAYSRSSNISTGYYKDPEEIIGKIYGESGAAAILWEPYSTIAEARGLKKIPLSNILGEYHCCLLVARDNIHEDVAEGIMKAHVESIEAIRGNMGVASHIFSEIVGLEPHIIERASNEYIYTYHIDRKLLREIASRARGPLANIEILENIASRHSINNLPTN